MAITQRDRTIGLKTPLEDDTLLLQKMSAKEMISRLFEYRLDMVSETHDIDFNKLVGDRMTVRFQMENEETRFFNGFVSKFTQVGFVGDLAKYEATLVPWLWFLTRTTDCRIFQNMKVPDIIKSVLRDNGFSDFEDLLTADYREWENCVQYTETDFNFVSRLMEQEGIYYYFRQEEDKHTLVLADSKSAHEPNPGYENIPFFPPDRTAVRDRDHISGWSISRQVQPGVYAQNDFDFKAPAKLLEASKAVQRKHPAADYEIFDYPGKYTEFNDGETYSNIRIQEIETRFETFRGEGNVQGLSAGCLFKLENLPRDDQNEEYLVSAADYRLESDSLLSGAPSDEVVFYCHFTTVSSKKSFRPVRKTPKPVIHGLQTAIVAGKSGEEIWTDEYGRVKVQFHWDRYGKSDENSSCWVRVAQLWAGKKWGGIHIPRVGQEVIVEFLEGDPDRPIITGRVYNGDLMPPYSLPANATQSGIKSQSSTDGSADNFNEIRFEDKKDSEELFLQAEKNWTINVKNDKNQTVGHDETLSAGNDRTKDIGNDEKNSVGNNRTRSVGNDETLTIGNNRTKSVGANQSETIGANKTISVGADHTESIGASMSVTVGSNKSETVAINSTETIGLAKEITVGATYALTAGASKTETIGTESSEDVGTDKSLSAGGDISESAGKDISLSAGKKMSLACADDFGIKGEKKGVIEIKDELTIKCGKASITIKKNGDISIKGKKINIKGSGDIVMKGKKILGN